MPAENTVTRPWQKTIDFVDAFKGKLPDEELAVIKKYVKKRSREAVQAQMTVTPDDTVQHCSPCSPNPGMSSDVCFKLKKNNGKMDPELKELESPSAGTGLETPGHQCPPNEATWETGRTTAAGFLTACGGSSQEGNILSPTELAKNTTTVAGTRHLAKRTSSSTPVEKERRYRLGTRLYLFFLFLGRAGRLLACASYFLSVLCLCFVRICFLNYCSFR